MFVPSQQVTSRLTAGLSQIPQNWALTPVDGQKRPYRQAWQKEEPLDREALARKIETGEREDYETKDGSVKQKFVKALGYGLRTGEVSGGILAIDADGHAAEELLQKLSNGDLPDTVIFTSGKPGRRQLLYYIPRKFWEKTKTVKLKTGVKGDDGKEQLLEFRWDGLQSVLPPSVHPETGSYSWVRSPQDREIAQCPLWVIELILNHNQAIPAPIPEPQKPTVQGRPPLEIFLGKDDRALVEYGAGDGERNDAACKLSLNLVGTARRLYELGIDYDGDPRALYYQFCAKCTPPLGSDVRGEAEGWWRKADVRAQRPSLDDEKLQGCHEAWLNKQRSHKQQSGGEKMPIVNGEAVYSEDERLRLALLDLAQEKDKIAKYRKRAQICSHYRLSKVEVDELIKETETKTSRFGLQRMSLNNLLDMEIQEMSWVIPELLPRGETIILAGAPKAGKTLMAIDAAFAIATGEGDFLGLRCEQGKVLLISNDESAQSSKRKLLKRGFRSGDQLEFVSNWTIDRLYDLEQVLDDFRPDVVIIDSLKSISTTSEISENSAEFANNIYALKNLLNQFCCAGILIHHTNKNKDAMGVAKLRGSTAIAGAVWGTWQIDHIPKPDPEGGKGLIIDPSDPNRILSVFARDVEGQLLKLEFDPENNSYVRTDKEVLKEQDKVRDRIIAVLRLNSDGLSGREVVEMLGLTQEQKHPVYTELTRMEAKKLVSTKKHPSDKRVTIYTLKNSNPETSKKGDSLSPPPSVPFDYYSPENHTQKGLQNSNQKNQNSNQTPENSNQNMVDYYSPEVDYYPENHAQTNSQVDSNQKQNMGGEGESPESMNNSTESEELPTSERGIQVGDRVEWTGDSFDVASECTGEVIDQVFGDSKVRWTRPDGSSFVRRDETDGLRPIADTSLYREIS